ncbi:MAG: ribosome maturation factor RimP [Treponema sp.]|nr:ribosome maturation factor RimP [Treponema sp.]
MEYTAYKTVKYYSECSPLVEALGYVLVELKIIPSKTITKISAVVASKNPDENMGVNDCAKVHRVLLPRLEALLGTEDTSMELTSPGIEHNIKNAAEFTVFTGRGVRVWDKEKTDWISGTIKTADEKSVTLETEGGESITVSYENIAKAKFIYTKEEA